jgi:hypothetical protein
MNASEKKAQDKNDHDKKRYWGKYRGKVLNNIDPKGLGKVLVHVPDVSGFSITSWAKLCMPYGGPQAGLFAPPPNHACVWVEFEQGDTDYPILGGAYYNDLEEKPALAPTAPPGVDVFYAGTTLQHSMSMSDVPGPAGGFLFKTPTGAFIKIDDTGITINNGKGAIITLVGPTVSINGAMLTIGPT